jgi:aspartate aminotransferase-like enzyme
MNRRTHLLKRISYMKEHIRSKDMLRFINQIERVLEDDEVEITDLYSQVKFLERQLDGYIPPLPEYDPDDEDDEK